MLSADATPDQFPPERVLAEIDCHDDWVDHDKASMQLHKATWATRYWGYGRGIENKGQPTSPKAGGIDIEVNRLAPAVNTYLASLYKVARRVALTPDPQGRGHLEAAQAALNAWLEQDIQEPVILSALRQGLLYPGCGLKVIVDTGTASALDRVSMRVVPWNELILDRSVSDIRDERFRGHIYMAPRKQIEEKHPELKGRLIGERRQDFLDPSNVVGSTRPNHAATNDGTGMPISVDDDYVRVVEFYNLVDTVEVDGVPYLGRLEKWVLNQKDGLSKRPFLIEPLPFAGADGVPLPPVVPLIFNAEPEFPYRGIAPVSRMMPQISEVNLCRSKIAESVRLNARTGIYDPGAFDADGLETLASGVDMKYAPIRKDWDKGLSAAILPLPQHPISQDLYNWMNLLAGDLAAVMAIPPAARGELSKGNTAFEVQTASLFTESEMGMHASVFNATLTALLKLVLRGIILALTRIEDSTGGFGSDDAALSATSGLTAPAALAAAHDTTPADVEAADVSGESSVLEAAAKMLVPAKATDNLGGKQVVQDTLRLLVGKTLTHITVDDLDAEFGIDFVEGADTPMTRAARQQAILNIGPVYGQLWQVVVKGGPDAIFAEQQMRAIFDQYDLPKDMSVDSLMEKWKKEQAKQPSPAPNQAPAPTATPTPPAQPPPAQDPRIRQALAQAIAAAQHGDVDGAIGALRTGFASVPQFLHVIDQVEAEPDPHRKAAEIIDLINTAMRAVGMPQLRGPMAGQSVNPAPAQGQDAGAPAAGA